jgi:hypothetical protein
MSLWPVVGRGGEAWEGADSQWGAPRTIPKKGLPMDISVSEEVQVQLDQVKEWMESKIGREVTYNDVILQILKNFQSVLYPEDLGSA